MPVIVKFRQSVANKAAVEQHLSVVDVEARDRVVALVLRQRGPLPPESYWPANTNVAVVADLAGVDAGNGVWGTELHSIRFKIGDAHVTTRTPTRTRSRSRTTVVW